MTTSEQETGDAGQEINMAPVESFDLIVATDSKARFKELMLELSDKMDQEGIAFAWDFVTEKK